MSARDIVVEAIHRNGPVPVSQVLDVALYHPEHGFYESGGSAGRSGGDFITSAEVGGLFGAVVAGALDGWWAELGRPDPFLIVEAGAGRGTLARSVLAAKPECAAALRYALVDRSAAQRSRHRELPLEDPALVLPPRDPISGQAVPDAPQGPLLTSLAQMPAVADVPTVVLANELLDNLACDLAERGGDDWYEVRVTVAGGELTEVLVPLTRSRSDMLDRLVPEAEVGARAPLQDEATSWLREALGRVGERGRVVVLDYAATTGELASRPQETWLRTYRRHGRGAGYLEELGHQDVTCDVAVDQLATVQAPVSDVTQQTWLRAWGITTLVEQAEAEWRERAPIGDLAALKARSRMNEASALLDPEGLGAFHVLEWAPSPTR